MSALPEVEGVSHRWVHARGLDFGVEDFVLRPSMLAGYERYTDDMRVELVENRGYFIADERPDLVATRAREFFAAF